MSNYFEYKDSIAFHPGYYIKELVDESGLTQEDFAKRLGTTPKNLSILINGEQSLSIDIAMKLSRLTDTSIDYWLNLQKRYDVLLGIKRSDEELNEERRIIKILNYSYFREFFHLPDLFRKIDEQIRELRRCLNVSSLSVLKYRDMAVKFRQSAPSVSEASIIKANAMVQIATIEAMKKNAPKFDKQRFEEAVSYILGLTSKHKDFYPLAQKAFFAAGVVFEVLPNIPGSKTNGATKKIGDNLLLMVNDRGTTADSFWFSLFHEIGHIHYGDYGISFEDEAGKEEDAADEYAENCLIPREPYMAFVKRRDFSPSAVIRFSSRINRDPGLVVGRLQNDNYVNYSNQALNRYKCKYKVCVS